MLLPATCSRFVGSLVDFSASLQYYAVVILLHRPFLCRNTSENPSYTPPAKVTAHHNDVCSHAAERISSIMRAYRIHFSLVRPYICRLYHSLDVVMTFSSGESPFPQSTQLDYLLSFTSSVPRQETLQSHEMPLGYSVSTLRAFRRCPKPGVGACELSDQFKYLLKTGQ